MVFEGRVLRAANERVRVDAPGPLEIEDHQIGRRALGQAPAFEAEDLAGCGRKPLQQVEQADASLVVEPQRKRQQGLQAGDARFGRGKGQALRFLIMRRVVAGDGIDGAVCQSGFDRLAVFLAA